MFIWLAAYCMSWVGNMSIVVSIFIFCCVSHLLRILIFVTYMVFVGSDLGKWVGSIRFGFDAFRFELEKKELEKMGRAN